VDFAWPIPAVYGMSGNMAGTIRPALFGHRPGAEPTQFLGGPGLSVLDFVDWSSLGVGVMVKLGFRTSSCKPFHIFRAQHYPRSLLRRLIVPETGPTVFLGLARAVAAPSA